MKKYVFFIFLIFSVVALGACEEGAVTEHRKVFSETVITYAIGDDADRVTQNLNLRTTSETVPTAILTWVSSEPSIIEIQDDLGVVIRPETTTTVILTLKVSIDDLTKQQKFSVTVIEDDGSITEDKTPPVIIGATDITLYVGDPEQDWLEGVYAEDNVDEVVEVTIIENTVDLNKSGSYHIVYEAVDQAGNKNQVTIIVTVLEPIIKPEITYTEEFNNVPSSGSVYGDISFTGINGILWTIIGSRSDQTLNGKAVTFGGLTDNSKLSTTIAGGVSSISFDAKRAFINTNERKLELKINGKSYGVFTINPESDSISHFEVNDINITGEFTLELVHITGSSSRAQITIDNLSWTTYSGIQVPIEKQNLDKDVADLNLITSFMEAATITLPIVGQYGSNIEWSYVNLENPNNNLVDLETGSVSVPDEGQVNVGLKATLRNGDYLTVKTFNLLIGEGDPSPILDVRNQTIAGKVKINGVITSAYEIDGAIHFFIQDETAGILVIASTAYQELIVPNNEVTLIGLVDVVNSEVRLNEITKLEVVGSKTITPILVNNPTTLKNYQGQLVEISGLLQKAYSSSATSFVVVNDKGSFELVIPNGLATSLVASIQNLLTEKDAGILVNVTASVSRYQNKYQLILVDSSKVVVDDELDQDVIWLVTSEYVNLPNVSKPISSNITLPSNIDVVDGLEIRWTSSHPNIISSYGEVNQIDREVEVTLTFDVLLNGVFIHSESMFVTVLEKSNYDGYYDSINGLTGSALKAELKRIISNMTNISYTQTSYILDESDVDPARPGNVLLVYNRASVSGEWNGSTWNKEHLWPQSKLGTASKSDLFNLRPANPSINSSRGNMAFADGSGTYGKVGSGWFPGEQDKGDVARAIFYMNTRWGLSINSQIGNLNTFIKWHNEDPVDDFERHRNEVIYSYQKNRNPYVDYPELVDEIFGTYTYVFSTINEIPTYLINFEDFKRDYYYNI